MAIKHTISSGQTLMDISIQRFGNLEDGLFVLLADNGFSLNQNLKPGTKINVSNEDAGITDVKTFYDTKGIVVVNIDEDALFTVLGDYNDDYNNDYD